MRTNATDTPRCMLMPRATPAITRPCLGRKSGSLAGSSGERDARESDSWFHCAAFREVGVPQVEIRVGIGVSPMPEQSAVCCNGTMGNANHNPQQPQGETSATASPPASTVSLGKASILTPPTMPTPPTTPTMRTGVPRRTPTTAANALNPRSSAGFAKAACSVRTIA